MYLRTIITIPSTKRINDMEQNAAKRIPYGISYFVYGWHISTKEEFNQTLGFSTEDVREMFAYYQQAGTTLHKTIMQFEGWELKRMEEME